jgi:hypothetical protein
MLSHVSEVKNRILTPQLRWCAALASLLLVLLLPDFAAAIPVRMSAVNPDEIHQNGDPVLDLIGWRDIATIPTCSNSGTTYYQCTSTANIDAQAAFPNLAFRASFDAWNAASGGGQWILHDGGPLPGGRFDVLIFKAVAQPTLGGLDILIMWNGAGAVPQDYYWSQALFNDYQPGIPGGGTTGPFQYKMDVDNSATPKYAPPLYPIQHRPGDNNAGSLLYYFSDGPRGPWPDASFFAQAFVSKVDYTAHTLTIYEGVSYSFVLSALTTPPPPVPEPSSIGVLLAWLFVMALAKRAW